MSETETKPRNPWADIATEPDLESQGAWVDDFLAPGWRIRVRSFNSPEARKINDRQLLKHRSILTANQGVLPPAIRDKVNAEVVARALVTGWEGIVDPDNGQPMECTPANVLRLCEHPKVGRKFRDEVFFLANQEALFRAQDAEAMAKN